MSALVPVPAAALEARPRQGDGWRAGRPVEDPEKMKRWGFVSAKPSEYLIHVKRGRVTKRSGQGASCFKWPWDAVAIVPTSLQRLGFRADQVTSEKIGVEVVGLAVYRIADPLLAFRVLNFSFPERAQEKLEETLTAMFVGATRRLVANLTVEECLQKRKSALAEELLREIAPVVAGEGRPEDTTDRGWGVVIDTIEIQEVRVLSEAVFAAMQAPTRATLEQRARDARAEAEKAIATHQAECEREIEQARIVAQQAVEELRAAAARKAAEQEAADALRRGELELERRRAELEGERRTRTEQLLVEASVRERQMDIESEQAEALHRQVLKQREHDAEQMRVLLDMHELKATMDARQAELARATATLDAELRKMAADAQQAEGLAQALVELRRTEAALGAAEADARRLMAQNLPALASAIGQRISEVKLTQFGGADNPFAHIGGALQAILDLVERHTRSAARERG